MTLTPDGYRPRLLDATIAKRLEISGAVCIEGPKHCGKTWTALNHANSAMMLDDPAGNHRNRALCGMELERAFVGDPPHLVDEWQRVPSIWDGTRMAVDSTPGNGRIILTSSFAPKKKGVMHSGAGRISTIRMRTMSLYESGHSDGRASLGSLFSETFQQSLSFDGITLEHLASLIVRGGWPGQAKEEGIGGCELPDTILDSIMSDAVGADGKRRVRRKLDAVVRSMAWNESTIASDTKVMDDVIDLTEESIDCRTFSEYRDVLDRTFMTSDQPAFDPHYGTRVRIGKKPKRHLADPSLAAAALGMTPDMLIDDLDLFERLFESMCERDLDVYAAASGGKLLHYHDHQGNDADAIVEMPDGRWGAFEFRLGMNQVDSAAERLLDLGSYMDKKRAKRMPSVLAVVCGMESSAYRREDGVYVLPITGLKN